MAKEELPSWHLCLAARRRPRPHSQVDADLLDLRGGRVLATFHVAPSSSDLNPLDYAIWSRMVREVNAERHSNMDSLKKAIKKSWRHMDEAFIKHVTGRFRDRLERALEGQGASCLKCGMYYEVIIL